MITLSSLFAVAVLAVSSCFSLNLRACYPSPRRPKFNAAIALIFLLLLSLIGEAMKQRNSPDGQRSGDEAAARCAL